MTYEEFMKMRGMIDRDDEQKKVKPPDWPESKKPEASEKPEKSKKEGE